MLELHAKATFVQDLLKCMVWMGFMNECYQMRHTIVGIGPAP
jgi:hypothetical protein